MSDPSSPPPPSSAAYVPYQAYKSKRHSRNLSGPSLHLVPNQSPPPISRPASSIGTPITLLQPPKSLFDSDHSHAALEPGQILDNAGTSTNGDHYALPAQLSPSVSVDPLMDSVRPGTGRSSVGNTAGQESVPQLNTTSSTPNDGLMPRVNGVKAASIITTTPSDPERKPLAGPSSAHSTAKKTSTFRRLPIKSTRQAQSTSHSRNVSISSIAPHLPEMISSEVQSPASTPTVSSPPVTPGVSAPTPPPPLEVSENISRQESTSSIPKNPPSNNSALILSTPTATPADSLPDAGSRPRHTVAPSRKPAPYRPGFQPKGVYRPLTDEFLALRRSIRDGEGQGGITRVERTKFERRLEKLIALHFPHPSTTQAQEGPEKERRPTAVLQRDNRRSSFFGLQSLRNLNINDAGELWRGVVAGGMGDTSKMDIRASEQRITPWQDDASVKQCPLCSSRDRCRLVGMLKLCGQIICSLPVRQPHRKILCSSLFVVDAFTRQIEEVGEGVDYGVKKRKVASSNGQQGRQEEEDKFLKGVRICRECRPILQRQQYYQQTYVVPPFAKFYENFINLETDIEESLPKFQELLMSLNHHDQPTKDASAARKRLLESFAQYDKLSKKIRALPCPNGPGSSQDRVQAAIMTRANLFLQKNMFPLQSLPTPQSTVDGSKSTKELGASNLHVDPDSALAHTLQPLLEQESLLESFVEEAQAQRKFEDVKTLKVNLAEIRQEIERILDGNKV